MDVESRSCSEPSLDRIVLVRAVVVNHKMDVQHRWNVGFDGTKKLQEFAAAVPAVCLANDFAGGHVQGGKQRRRAVAHVVVRASPGSRPCATSSSLMARLRNSTPTNRSDAASAVATASTGIVLVISRALHGPWLSSARQRLAGGATPTENRLLAVE